MTSHLDDPAYWRKRAEEARLIADQMTDPEAKEGMLQVAASYNGLADRAAQRAKHKVTD